MLSYLSAYGLTVVHKSGASCEMLLADTLSRLQTPPTNPVLIITNKSNKPLAEIKQDPDIEVVQTVYKVNIVTRSQKRATEAITTGSQDDSTKPNKTVVPGADGEGEEVVGGDKVDDNDNGDDNKDASSSSKLLPKSDFETAESDFKSTKGDPKTHIEFELGGVNTKTNELLTLITEAQLSTKTTRQKIELLRKGVVKCNHRGPSPCEKTDCVVNRGVLELAEKYKVNSKNQLFRVLRGEYLLVVPDSIKATVIKKLHSEHHRGVSATVDLVKRLNLFVHQLISSVVDIIQSCEQCSMTRSAKMEALNTSKRAVPSRPFATVSADLVHFTVKGEQKAVLTIVDHFSNFVWADLLRGLLTRHIKCGFYKFFAVCATPSQLKTDNASNLCGEEMKVLYDTLNIVHSRISAGNSRANSKVEYANRRIIETIRSLNQGNDISDEFELQYLLSQAVLLLNSECDKNGCSPFLTVNGSIPGFIYGTQVSNKSKELATMESADYFQNLEKVRQECQTRLILKAQSSISSTTKIKRGDYVRIKLKRSLKHLKKFSQEVYLVLDVKMNCLKLQKMLSFNGTPVKGQVKKVHARFCKKVQPPADIIEEEAPTDDNDTQGQL